MEHIKIKTQNNIKKIILVFVIILLMFSMFLPRFLQKKIKTVNITKVIETNYSEDIFVSGIVEPESKNDVIASMPIVPEKVCVKLG
ncbi:MAG: hypothetical protein RSA99_00230, partial [Oscillospiraceae bacterium]